MERDIQERERETERERATRREEEQEAIASGTCKAKDARDAAKTQRDS